MLRNALARFPGLAKAFEVKQFDRSRNTYALVARVDFNDGSRLFIKDYLFPDRTRKYSFHWQSADATLLSRWDNESHWASVETFPNHQHNHDGSVGPSYIRSLDAVIEHIARALGFHQDP